METSAKWMPLKQRVVFRTFYEGINIDGFGLPTAASIFAPRISALARARKALKNAEYTEYYKKSRTTPALPGSRQKSHAPS